MHALLPAVCRVLAVMPVLINLPPNNPLYGCTGPPEVE